MNRKRVSNLRRSGFGSKTWALGFGIWALSFALAACGRSPAALPPSYLTVGIRAAPNSLDPRIGTDEGSSRVTQPVYSRLMRIDDQLRVGPNLATALDHPDPLTYIAHLRQGVMFH